MNVLAQSLQDRLLHIATQEFTDKLLRGLQALQEHSYTEHELELINALDGSNEDLVIIQGAADCIFNHLMSVCRMHRVTVADDADIVPIAAVVRALLLMQYWEDKDTIIDLCDSDASDEDRLCALIAIVGELTEHQAQDVIEEVDPNFLRGLKNLYTTDAFSVEDPAALQIPPEQIEKLRQWRKLMSAERTLGFRMVKSGYSPGAALNQYIQRVVDKLSEGDNKAIAFEMVPFLLLGRDSWQNPLAAWRTIAPMLSLEARDITAVDVEILKLLGEFDRLNTQGASK